MERHSGIPWAAAALLVALAVVSVLMLYARGGGPLPAWATGVTDETPAPLRPSSPEEATLRALRLAGFAYAAADGADDEAMVRLRMPRAPTPGHVLATVRTGFGVLSRTYPDARRYAVQVFGETGPLLSVTADGDDVREAVEADDVRLIEDSAVYTLLAAADPAGAARHADADDASPGPGIGGAPDTFLGYVAAGLDGSAERFPSSSLERVEEARALVDAEPVGAEPLSAGAMATYADLAGRYLDAKNRAAHMDEHHLRETLSDMRASLERVAGLTARAVAPADVSRTRFYLDRLAASLEVLSGTAAVGSGSVEGAAAVREEAEGLLRGGDDPAPRLKELSEAARAVEPDARAAAATNEGTGPPGPGMGSAAYLARLASERDIRDEGPLAGAVLALARHPAAPPSAYELARFDVPSAGALSRETPRTVSRVLDRAGGRTAGGRRTIAWPTDTGRTELAYDEVVPYQGPAGDTYWRPGGDAPVAVVDTTLAGALFTVPSGASVDVHDVGRVWEVYLLP